MREKKKVRKAKNPAQLSKEMERLICYCKREEYLSIITMEKITEQLERNSLSLPSDPSLEEPKRNYSELEKLLRTDFKEMYDSLSLEMARAFWRSIIKQIHLNDDCTIKEVDFL